VHHNVRYLELNLSTTWQRANSPLPLSPVNCDEMSGTSFLGHLGEVNEVLFAGEFEANSVA
jgi:hypothetical protein